VRSHIITSLDKDTAEQGEKAKRQDRNSSREQSSAPILTRKHNAPATGKS